MFLSQILKAYEFRIKNGLIKNKKDKSNEEVDAEYRSIIKSLFNEKVS